MNYQELADISLAGDILPRGQCAEVLDCPDEDILALLNAAYRVRRANFGNAVHIQLLTNAKSGLCPEDCHYCSQSRVATSEIAEFPLISREELLKEARRAVGLNAKRYCMVISGRAPGEDEIARLCEVVKAIKQESPLLSLCCSLGIMQEDQAKLLKAAGLDRVNHNLNTSERFYPEICTTHTFADRLRTIELCRAAGLEICSGGILGQGESDDDVIDFLLTLRKIKAESIPLNFLVPVEGTPFQDRGRDLDPRRCLKILCLARFLNPETEIRAAGGREHHLRSLQPLALYAVNSIFVSGYLTTGGQSAEEAKSMIADLGFELEFDGVSEELRESETVTGADG